MVSNESVQLSVDRLRKSTLKVKAGALFCLYHTSNSLEEVAYEVESLLVELLSKPRIEDLYWKACIEYGVRTYANLQSKRFRMCPEDAIADSFYTTMNRILEINDESIIGWALTAIIEDAPSISQPLLQKVKELSISKSNVDNLRPLFGECIRKLVNP